MFQHDQIFSIGHDDDENSRVSQNMRDFIRDQLPYELPGCDVNADLIQHAWHIMGKQMFWNLDDDPLAYRVNLHARWDWLGATLHFANPDDRLMFRLSWIDK